jgi:hypothetical protein
LQYPPSQPHTVQAFAYRSARGCRPITSAPARISGRPPQPPLSANIQGRERWTEKSQSPDGSRHQREIEAPPPTPKCDACVAFAPLLGCPRARAAAISGKSRLRRRTRYEAPVPPRVDLILSTLRPFPIFPCPASGFTSGFAAISWASGLDSRNRPPPAGPDADQAPTTRSHECLVFLRRARTVGVADK